MKKLLTILGILALVSAAPMFAQVTGASPEDTRTNPNAGNATTMSKLTIQGTIQSWNSDEIVLNTQTGAEHIRLTDRTRKPTALKVGDKVAVEYTRTSQGVMIAQLIRNEGSMAGTVKMDSEPMAMDHEMDDMDNDSMATTTTTTRTTTVEDDGDLVNDNQNDTYVSPRQTLPQTASGLPFLLALGLGAAAGAAGFRALR